MKKHICIGILVLMVIFLEIPVAAAAGSDQNAESQSVILPQYTYIATLIPGLSINSSGKATCSGMASTYDSSHTIRLTVGLQKYNSGGWSTIKSWSATAPGPHIADVYEDYYVVHGTYRVCSTAKVYNASDTLLESKSVYSSTVTY